MSEEYTIYIDESGDEGLSGKSAQMFCLGAFIINNTDYDKIIQSLSNIRKLLNKQELHACAIKNHITKTYVCQQIAKLPIVSFGVISNKSSLKGYKITEHWKYYNKNCQYLLELIGKYIKDVYGTKIKHKIIFEHKKNAEYQRMRNLITFTKEHPIYGASKVLDYIDEESIISKPKEDEPLLEIADFIAHSLQRCCNHFDAEFGITENRYLNEIRNTFHHNTQNHNILFYGIKPIHKIMDLNIKEDASSFLTNLKVD